MRDTFFDATEGSRMLTVREIGPRVWELTLDGVVEKADIETMERELTPVLEGDGPLGLIVRAETWADITGDAIAEDARFELGLMNKWAKVAKMAIVSDLQAVAALLRWVDPILPMIDMRSFPASKAAEAEAFVSDLPRSRAEARATGGMTLLSDGSDGVIAYEIDGRISARDVYEMLEPLEACMKGDGKIDLLVRFKEFDGFDPALFGNASLFGAKFGAITHLRRYAVIGAPRWIAAMAGAAAALLPFEMRLFDASEDSAAWTWVRGA
jgi:hypothetical protein